VLLFFLEWYFVSRPKDSVCNGFCTNKTVIRLNIKNIEVYFATAAEFTQISVSLTISHYWLLSLDQGYHI
jgi:hypothetical protein